MEYSIAYKGYIVKLANWAVAVTLYARNGHGIMPVLPILLSKAA